jgi:hypothetical protein
MRVSDLHKRILAQSQPLLLDLFPNASAAYSLRKLRTAYTGNCIEVRRSSDNTLQNIGFVNNVLDTASLLSFVGAGSGFVRTWYDQSGGANNVTQLTNSRQPIVVENGNLFLLNNKLTLDFRINQNLNGLFPIYKNVNKGYIFSFSKSTNTDYSTLVNFAFSTSGTAMHWIARSRLTNQRWETGGRRLSNNSFQAIESNTNDGSNSVLITSYADYENSDLFLYQNSQLVVSSTSFQTNGSLDGNNKYLFIGSITDAGTNTFRGQITEIISYNLDQSSNRTTIETNINSFYNIY